MDILFRGVDILDGLLTATDGKETEVLEAAIDKIKHELFAIVSDDVLPDSEEPSGAEQTAASSITAGGGAAVGERTATATMDSIKIAAGKLDALLLQAEEMLAVKRATIQHSAESLSLLQDAEVWNREWKKIDQPVRVIRQFVDRSSNVTLAQACLIFKKYWSFWTGIIPESALWSAA